MPHARESGGVRRELDAESFDDAEKRGEPRVAAGGQSFIKGFACDTGLAGELSHAHGASDVGECGRNQCRIAVLEGGSEISGDGLGLSRYALGSQRVVLRTILSLLGYTDAAANFRPARDWIGLLAILGFLRASVERLTRRLRRSE